MDKLDLPEEFFNFTIKQEIEIKIEPLEPNVENLCNENTFAYSANCNQNFMVDAEIKNSTALKHSEALNKERHYDQEPVAREFEVKIKEVEVNREGKIEIKNEKEIEGRKGDKIEVKKEEDDDSENVLFSRIRNSKFPIVLLKKLNIRDKKKLMKAEKSGGYEEILKANDLKKERSPFSSVTNKKKTKSHKMKKKEGDKCTEHNYKFKKLKKNRLLKHSTSKLHTCSQCPYETSNKSSIRRHKLTHLSQMYTCSHCNYKSVRKEHLNLHLAVHSEQKWSKCSECSYVSKRTDHFETHRLRHFSKDLRATSKQSNKPGSVVAKTQKVKLFKCSECNFETTSKTTLKKHLLLTHSDFKMLKCSDCSYETTRPYHLTEHSIVHSKPLFSCLKCNYKAKWKHNLQLHALTHTGVKRFGCSKCNFRCNDSRNLQAHELNHSNTPKLFSCSQCKYASNYRNNLRRHMLTHSDTKLLKCSQCEFKTNYKFDLKMHSLRHSGVRWFRCCDCEYTTNDKRLLATHLLKHSDAKLFKCPECDYECNVKRYLDSHVLNYHMKTE